jgi:hypothetical protein
MTDKCSFFFGGSHNPCCEQHDKDYGRESTISRREADKKLRLCVIEKGHPVRAWVMWVGVRVFGWFFYKGRRSPR